MHHSSAEAWDPWKAGVTAVGDAFMPLRNASGHSIAYRSVLVIAAVLGLAIVLLAFQEWPGLSASSHAAMSDSGYAQCLSNGWRDGQAGCSNLGQPFGGVHVFGLPTAALAAALFGWDGSVTFDELQFVSALFTTIAFCGAALLFRRLTGSIWLGLLGAVLYLLSPIVSQQGAYGALRTGYALLPFYLLVDSSLLGLHGKRWNRRAMIIAIVALVRIFAVLCDGYSFVMSSGLALSLFLVAGLSSRRINVAAIPMALYVAACAMAYWVYFLCVPGAQSGLGTMPIDFFRGQGVDLYTMVMPSPLFWLYRSIGIAFDFPAAAAFGDGSNVVFNFAGYSLLVATAIVLAVCARRRRRMGTLLASLALSALVAFFFSLGPSLKYRSLDVARASVPANFNTYLMPADKAVLSLGTDKLYLQVPGVQNIRVLARWQGVVHFALVAFLLVLLSWLLERKRRVLACIIAFAALLETAPNLAAAYPEGRARRDEAEAVRDDYLRELLQLTAPNERAVLLQLHDGADSNQYTADYFCPKADLRCYNAAGDKTIEIVREYWPQEIEELLARRNIEPNIRQLFRDRKADVVLVTLFDLRHLAYSRSEAAVDSSVVKQRVDAIVAAGGYLRSDGQYFISLRPGTEILRDPKCGLRCWIQWPIASAAHRIRGWGPRAEIKGQGFNRQINGRSAFWVQVDDDPGRYVITFGGTLLPSYSGNGVVTALMPSRMERGLMASRSYNVGVIDINESKRISLGEFKVLPPSHNN